MLGDCGETESLHQHEKENDDASRLRLLTVNAAYWCVGLEDKIEADSDVSPLFCTNKPLTKSGSRLGLWVKHLLPKREAGIAGSIGFVLGGMGGAE